MNLNPFQRAVADTFMGGEFSHVQDIREAELAGDTLFLFLIRELDDVEDGDDARGRLTRAMGDVQVALSAVEDL